LQIFVSDIQGNKNKGKRREAKTKTKTQHDNLAHANWAATPAATPASQSQRAAR